MATKRYIQSKFPPYDLVEVTQDFLPATRTDSGALWGDRHYDGMRAPDGTDISTRTKHREYMRATGLTTTDDFKDTWAKAKQEREQLYSQGGTFRRQDIERAIHNLQERNR
jgi:hypothetical protein